MVPKHCRHVNDQKHRTTELVEQMDKMKLHMDSKVNPKMYLFAKPNYIKRFISLLSLPNPWCCISWHSTRLTGLSKPSHLAECSVCTCITQSVSHIINLTHNIYCLNLCVKFSVYGSGLSWIVCNDSQLGFCIQHKYWLLHTSLGKHYLLSRLQKSLSCTLHLKLTLMPLLTTLSNNEHLP